MYAYPFAPPPSKARFSYGKEVLPAPVGTTGGTFTEDRGGSSRGSAFDSNMIDVSFGVRAMAPPRSPPTA